MSITFNDVCKKLYLSIDDNIHKVLRSLEEETIKEVIKIGNYFKKCQIKKTSKYYEYKVFLPFNT